LFYKIKLVFRLVLELKILTSNSLQKRGWYGPSICSLCFRDEDSISHIFIYYPFTLKLWKNLHIAYNLATKWGGNSLNNFFEDWVKVEKLYKTLPIIVCWYLWLKRNKCIFDSCLPSVVRVCIQIRGMMKPSSCQLQTRTHNRIKKTLDIILDNICSFDGATQLNGTLCVEGGVIKTIGKTSYRWTLNCGQGSNTRA